MGSMHNLHAMYTQSIVAVYVHSLVGGVTSIQPDPVETQREELPDDGPKGSPSSQQQLNESSRVDSLQCSACNSTVNAKIWV